MLNICRKNKVNHTSNNKIPNLVNNGLKILNKNFNNHLKSFLKISTSNKISKINSISILKIKINLTSKTINIRILKQISQSELNLTDHLLRLNTVRRNSLNQTIIKITKVLNWLSLSLTIISRGELVSESSVIDKIEENSEEVPKIPENNN